MGRGEVSVPQGILHGLVPQQFLHGDDVRPGHQQPSGERVPQVVKPEILDAGPSARRCERMVQALEAVPLSIREDLQGADPPGERLQSLPEGAVDGGLPPVPCPDCQGAEVSAGVESEEGEVNSRSWRELLGRYIFGLQEKEYSSLTERK